MTTTAYKVFTSDLRSPIQKGEPVWDGSLPHTLPAVEVDASDRECGAGWNACLKSEDAIKIAGLWSNGGPSRLFKIETDAQVIERGNKVRSSTWTITDEIMDLRPAIERFSKPFDCPGIVDEQLAWMEAFGSPSRDREAIEAGLREALDTRGLTDWTLKECNTGEVVSDPSEAWDFLDIMKAWEAWEAKEDKDARYAWDDRDAWSARAAWDSRGNKRARGARAALTLFVAGKKGWTKQDPHLLTVGLRDAYRNGLGVAIPTGPKTLGWGM